MLDSLDIARLYENVLATDMSLYNISPEAVKFGIDCMAHVYSETVGLKSERSQVADYTDPAHRCAYLHKYAALHTAMVRDMMIEAIRENYNLFYRLVHSGDLFRLCCLGGGPGTDVIGVLCALHASFGYFQASATVVDYMAEWSFSFASILKELGSGWYGAFGNNLSYYLDWRYLGANLLKTFKPDVLETLSSASLVTMVKFTSAAACMDTRNMIRNIFRAMKPGAALLFIDNDGGGFNNLIEDTAVEFDFIPVFGPRRRESYLNLNFRKKKFGVFSCCRTTVTVQVLMKQIFVNPYYDNFPNAYSNRYMPDNRRENFANSFIRPSLLASPPTPFLYLGQSPNENYNVPSRPSLGPISPHLPAIESPHTPFSPYMYHSQGQDENGNRLGYSSVYDVKRDFLQDENICRVSSFVSSPVDIPQSPSPNYIMRSHVVTPLTTNFINSPVNMTRQRSVIYTPDSQPRRGKKARMQGCLPLRNFRHHISKKVIQIKARARKVFKSKNKKPHPIFKI